MKLHDAAFAGALVALLSMTSSGCSEERDNGGSGDGASSSGGAGDASTGGAGSGGDPTSGGTGGVDFPSAGGSATALGGAPAGAGGSGDTAGSGGSHTADPELAPVHVAVGYGGLKVRSLDGGLTWSEPDLDPDVGTPEDPTCVGDACELLCTGGDDRCLLRDVAFENGLFVAVGWKIFTSEDGRDWQERTLEGQQWMGGVEYGNGRWLAVGGCGMSLFSLDAITWTQGTNASSGCGHVRELAFGAGVFVATGAYNSGDLAGTPISVRATDETGWTPVGEPDLGNFVDFVDGIFVATSRSDDAAHYATEDGNEWELVDAPIPHKPLDGVYLRSRSRRIERSENGVDFVPVTGELPGAVSGFAVGWVPTDAL